MWALNFLPDIVFHLILIFGVILLILGYFLGSVPFITKYRLMIQVCGMILTVLGVWYEGGIAKDTEYKLAVADMEKKVLVSERLAAETSAKIEYVFLDKVKIVKEQQIVLRDRIRDVAIKIDRECRIIPEAVNIINDAAKKPSRQK